MENDFFASGHCNYGIYQQGLKGPRYNQVNLGPLFCTWIYVIAVASEHELWGCWSNTDFASTYSIVDYWG